MSAKVRYLLGAGVATLLIAPPIVIWATHKESRQLPLQPRPTEHKLTLKEITAGVPFQRQRIVDFIEQTGSYTNYEELVAGLNDPVATDFDIVQAAGVQVSGIPHANAFLPVLADRRVARLYEMLEGMPADEAERRAAELFHAKLKIQREAWMKGIDDWRRDGVGPTEYVPTLENYHATACSLFLCSRFCKPADVLTMLGQWNETFERIEREIKSDENWPKFHPKTMSTEEVQRFAAAVAPKNPLKVLLLRSLSHEGKPDNLYVLNLYFSCLGQGSGLDKQALFDRLDPTISLDPPTISLSLERMPLVAWDAHTNPFDFTHFHRGVPTDKSEVLTEVTVERNWNGWVARPDQLEIVGTVRDMVEDMEE